MTVMPAAPPIEVSERIIDFVAQRVTRDGYTFWENDVKETLRACALTCHAWTPRSQFHLFRIVVVKCYGDGEKTVEDFISLLRRHQALHSHIETLLVHAGPVWQIATLPLFNAVALKLPIERMSHLRHLRLSGGVFYPPPSLRCPMPHMASVTSLSLVCITFHSVHDLRRAICSLQGLQRLHLFHSPWSPSDGKPRSTHFPKTPVRLERLNLVGDGEWVHDNRSVHFVEWLARSGIVSSLRIAFLNGIMIIEENMLWAIGSLLRASNASLEMAALSFGPDAKLSERK